MPDEITIFYDTVEDKAIAIAQYVSLGYVVVNDTNRKVGDGLIMRREYKDEKVDS